MAKYNQLRPLAFYMNQESVANKPEFTAYPFWTLELSGELKRDLLKILAKASNRTIDKVYLPVQILNSAARMLIPNLIAIEQYTGRINARTWLYGFVGPNGEQPASPDAILLLIRSWIRTAFPKIPPTSLRPIAQQLTPNMFQWKREAMDLTHWKYAKNDTAIPYEKNTNRNGFVTWPDLIAAKLSQATLEWGRHTLTFKRIPTSPGQHGVELVSWPPLEEKVNERIWPYSVLLILTLQTVPFQNFPVLHCAVGIRRWAGSQVYLPGKIETSVYLLDQVPWIQGLPDNQCFQVAPIKWGAVPANEETGETGGPRLGWGGDLIPLLSDLHIGEKVFPDPRELADDPYRFIRTSSQSPAPTAAIVYREGLKPAHEAGIGFMPRDRGHFAEKVAAILHPDFIFVPPYERRIYDISLPPNPFFEEKKKSKTPPTEAEVLQAKTVAIAERLKSVHSAVPSLKLIIRYQSEEVHRALHNAIEELLGSSSDAIASQRVSISSESQPLGRLGEKLLVKAGSYVTRYDRQREAISQRATDIATQLIPAPGDTGVLIELDNEDMFSGDDPKPALRIGFGRKGYHTQFITPQSNDNRSSKKNKDQIDTQLRERARAAVRDLLRQFGVIGSLPVILSKPRKKQENQLRIPDTLHYLGAWLIKLTQASPTHIVQEIPVLVHMASNSWGIEVLAPGWDDWLSYRKAQLNLLTQPVTKVFKPEETSQFLLETLDICLPNFEDTILFCHAQNLRSSWKWLGNEAITQTLPEELKQLERLRIVRLRTGEPEIPEWYAQKGQDEYGFASGIFAMGTGGQVFAGLQKKPLTMKELSKDSSKAFSQTKLIKKTQEVKTYDPRPDIRAWNPGICEFTISCSQPEDALMCAVVTNELRDHFAAHFRSPTVYPIPLHLASLLNPYMLPLNKPLRGDQSEADGEE